MIPILDQDSAGNLITKVVGFGSNVSGMRESTMSSIEVIGQFIENINSFVSSVGTVINNPIIITTFIGQVSLVILLIFILLKMLGFENLDKWISLTVLIKVITIIL